MQAQKAKQENPKSEKDQPNNKKGQRDLEEERDILYDYSYSLNKRDL